jgi:hypothetical protein
MRAAFNIREGLNPLKFKVPGRCLGRPPIRYDPFADVTIDKENEDTMIISFLTVMDRNVETAKPSKKKLEVLGFKDVAERTGWL